MNDTFGQWLEIHRDHEWGITMASNGEQVGVIAECYTCGTVEQFGIVDPIEIMMKHWTEEHGGIEESITNIARA